MQELLRLFEEHWQTGQHRCTAQIMGTTETCRETGKDEKREQTRLLQKASAKPTPKNSKEDERASA